MEKNKKIVSLQNYFKLPLIHILYKPLQLLAVSLSILLESNAEPEKAACFRANQAGLAH